MSGRADQTPEGIPTELYEELVRLRPVLEEHGAIIPRRDTHCDSYQLRVRVEDERLGRVHRGIGIRGLATAEAVRKLIESWRAEKEAKRKAEAEAQGPPEESEEEIQKRVIADLRRQYLRGAGGAKRQRLAREFDRATESPAGLLCLGLSGSAGLPARRPGRRPKSGLS